LLSGYICFREKNGFRKRTFIIALEIFIYLKIILHHENLLEKLFYSRWPCILHELLANVGIFSGVRHTGSLSAKSYYTLCSASKPLAKLVDARRLFICSLVNSIDMQHPKLLERRVFLRLEFIHWIGHYFQIMPLCLHKALHASIVRMCMRNDLRAHSHLVVHFDTVLSNSSWKAIVKYTNSSLLAGSFSKCRP
jgi:hypothetical protein